MGCRCNERRRFEESRDSIIRALPHRLSRPVQFIVENWILILAAFVSGALLVWPMVSKGGIGASITTADAVRLINQEKAVLIDVREPSEFAAGHAAGARNVPLGALEGAKGLPSNKAVPLVVVCATGARSSRAAAQLRKAGYGSVHNLAGGNAAWRDASLPIEKSA
jgi:rhodanese-related sulfurtransferase